MVWIEGTIMIDDDAGSFAGRLEAYLGEWDRRGILLDVEDDETMPSCGVAEGSLRVGDLRRAVAAIRELRAEMDRLRRERNALLIDLVFRNAVDDAHAEGVLDTPSCVAFILGDAIRFSGCPVAEKYLDMPSDLGATAPPLPRRNLTDPAD